MSDDNSADFFAPPAFKPAEALVQLKRSLRDLRGLTERGAGFDWKGTPVIELAADDKTIQARLVKRPLRSPDWETRSLAGSAEVRRFIDDVKQRVARWKDADE